MWGDPNKLSEEWRISLSWAFPETPTHPVTHSYLALRIDRFWNRGSVHSITWIIYFIFMNIPWNYNSPKYHTSISSCELINFESIVLNITGIVYFVSMSNPWNTNLPSFSFLSHPSPFSGGSCGLLLVGSAQPARGHARAPPSLRRDHLVSVR